MPEEQGLRAWAQQASSQRRFVSVSSPRNEKPAGLLTGASFVTYRVASVDLRCGKRVVEVRRRFSDFIALRESLCRRFSGLVLPAPESPVLGGALVDPLASRATMTARRERGLSAFADVVCSSPFLSRDAVTIAFFELEPYSSWDALRKSLGLSGAVESEARSAEQACERANVSPLLEVSGSRRWLEALTSKSAADLALDTAAARFESARRVETSSVDAIKAARYATQCATQYATALAKLGDALRALGHQERDVFRGRKDYGADALTALAADYLRPLEARARQHADAIDRYVAAPLREEAVYVAALRGAVKKFIKPKKPNEDVSASAAEMALRVEAERLAPRFAAACRASRDRFAARVAATPAAFPPNAPVLDASFGDDDRLLAVALALTSTTSDNPYAFLKGDAETQRRSKPSGGKRHAVPKPTSSKTTVIPKQEEPPPVKANKTRPPPPPRRASANDILSPRTAKPPPPPPKKPSQASPKTSPVAGLLADIRKFDSSTLATNDDDAGSPRPAAANDLMSDLLAKRRAFIHSDAD
ncbi:hypothetical protein CTAYLR_000842 [Chrysophaeum taylorii]|uniref:PX domain-containing protein n=1 Tax=Chrysophaeum taylorii TaxID=2483200 RepID=A0AAD7UQ96_9STRA|nr:hypothetical protein CTAYLR_000842 [Chrysophaeum taylorii]